MQRISGYGAVFNSEAVIGGMFREVITPGAFRDAIGRDDVRALFNHDPNLVLGRTKAGTLTLTEDAHGLRYDVTPPEVPWVDALVVSMKRGDVTQSSFGFRVTAEAWHRAAMPLREILAVELFDVSPVTYPAYEATTVAARDGLERRSTDGRGEEQRSHGGAIAALLRLKLAIREPCEGCKTASADGQIGWREGHRIVYRSVCALCKERWVLEVRTRHRRGETAQRQRLARAEAALRLARAEAALVGHRR